MRRPLIRKLEKFTRLSQADKEMLVRIAAQRIRRFTAREDIIHEGEKPEFINLINEGWACRYKTLDDGRRQIIAFFLPGDLCDLNVFILKEMDHSIGAITPVAISEISRTDFDEMMIGHPRITQALWWESLVAAAIQREWTVNLGQRDALERMAHLLCELFIRLEASGCTSDNSCEFPLTQTELGETLGMSTVHVNRTLQELRASNLIVLKDRTLTIPNLQALQDVALFNANYLHLDREGRHLDANEE
ncbi:Crp/Fnr family transcriptional regulator [Mesorhizobium sp. WSM4976]|uniref:Crp/Fnr family transcriptional regulator n=1 Tax=Mesorhizobium sp. WSM4976 TaxID=3038549 RepID=UPI002417FB5D|nr:Crp/Fnr family transcriptional regulator [Mesorhizobium sp. WSM4976]MDG4892334.1 Crp/Fnr family transcriptional regulator [Mesorhizobium sp. WSM4976]